ncbi:MAG: T9SS C-terminal target domain-containing protein [Gemmatimonadetes bacterium]|nr:MAG: T9SS C-terminal target domain-containing protein [Gemmatimonadota bacterium]
MNGLCRFIFTSLIVLLMVFTTFAREVHQLLRVPVETESQIRDILSYPFDFASCRYPVLQDENGNRFIDIVARRADANQLAEMGYQPVVISADLQAEYDQRVGHLRDMGAYHTVQEMIDELNQIHETYPEITHLESIGQSYEGRDIWAIKVSDNVETNEPDEPEVLYTANMHSREVITPEVLLYFLNYLVDNYGVDDAVTEIIDNRQLWIIPTYNPDGHIHVENENAWWRKNRRDNGDGTFGVDLNRNFGYMWGYDNIGSSPNSSSETYRGTHAFSEPESQAIRDFVAAHHFVVGLSYHSYGNLWLFPWGYEARDTHHDAVFMELAQTATAFNGYTPGNVADGVIYVTNGDTDDWAYGETTETYRYFSLTPEVGTFSDGFWPPESRIPSLVEENLEPNLYYAQIAGNMPYHLAPPYAPTINPLSYDNDGTYQVSWTPEIDEHNPIVQYALKEQSDYNQFTDECETNDYYTVANGFTMRTNRHYSGERAYFGGHNHNMSSTCTALNPVVVTEQNSVFQFYTWYDIEMNWDYAYVELSTDGGETWEPIPGNITTESNPYGQNRGHGITGSSNNSWVLAEFDLSAYQGQLILIRFHYVTDGGVLGEGFYIDDIYPTTQFGSEIILDEAILEPVFEIVDQPEGLYVYTVRALDDDDQWSEWSRFEAVHVEYAATTGGSEPVTDVPTATRLFQNYPNPFNPRTTIRYEIAQNEPIQLTIYDVAGKIVRQWNRDHPLPGQYQLEWDGTDNQHQPVESGLYLYQLKTPTTQFTQTAMLIK